MDLQSSDILQIDATIITGLLILLTIQAYTGTIPTQSYEHNKLEVDEKRMEIQTLNNTLMKLKEKATLIPENDTRLTNLYQNEIDKTEFELLKATEEYRVRNSNVVYTVDGADIVDVYRRVEDNSFKILAISMMIPFASSAVLQLSATCIKREKYYKALTNSSKLLVGIGFVIIIFGLSRMIIA